MFVDARELERDALLEADLCIVGAGAAGITLALELLDSPLSVVVLESGAFGYEQETQALYGGEQGGSFLTAESEYLISTRLRHFGGTTGHWGGWCRPLDPEDLAPRPWVELGGWPIGRDELTPFYDRAREIIALPPFDDDADAAGLPLLLPPGAAFDTTFLHVNPLRFASTHGRMLRRAERVRVVIYANVVQIAAAGEPGRVEAIEGATLAGGRFRVRARAYVLAAGGIENARLLLASNRTRPAGLGNERDLVGRSFMEHPLVRVGHLVSTNPRYAEEGLDTYSSRGGPRRGGRYRGALRLRPELQRAEGLLNALVFLWRVTPGELPELAREVAAMSAELQGRELGRIRCWQVGIAAEQLPNPESRVRLIAERDALGMPRTGLDWRLTELDAHTVRRTSELLAAEIGAGLGGRVSLVESDNPWRGWDWSKHHMGTTRMDPDPARGVVDADCRLHGLPDLYLAGSSVFPTAGASNPTLTIVALAVRLARHLRAALSA